MRWTMPRSLPLIAFQGEPGAFSHTAALKLLGPRSNVLACQSFKEVFEALRSQKATFAVIPIENTLHGSIHENYDHLLEYEVSITGETSVRIAHHLIAMPGVSFRKVRRAFSHPVALNQCRHFFERYPAIEGTPFYDTAGSVKMLKEQALSDAAAVASETAAGIYGGIILKRNIEDNRENFTRFFLLTKQRESRLTEGTNGRRHWCFPFRMNQAPYFEQLPVSRCGISISRNLSRDRYEGSPGNTFSTLMWLDTRTVQR